MHKRIPLRHAGNPEVAVIYLYFGFPFFFRAEATVGAQIWIVVNIVKCRIHVLWKKRGGGKSYKIHSRIKHKTNVNVKCCPHLRAFSLVSTRFNIKYYFATAWNEKVCKTNLSVSHFKQRLLWFCPGLGLMEWKSERGTVETTLREGN